MHVKGKVSKKIAVLMYQNINLEFGKPINTYIHTSQYVLIIIMLACAIHR